MDYASVYTPGVTPLQAVAEAEGRQTARTATQAGYDRTGLFSDPTVWIIVLLAVWAGIVHFGLDVKVGK